MSRGKKWLYRLIALCLGIILCEVALQIAAAVSPRVRFYLSAPWKREVRVPDPELGYRMSPLYPGNDAWGFRNSKVPDNCEVLALGDSMTYGFAAPADKCWPRQLERLTDKTVYNMSCGGYCLCEYAILLDKGLTLDPKTVIIGMYLGNDISEAYRTVHMDKRAQEFNDGNEAVKKEIEAADQAKTLEEVHAEFQEKGKPAEEEANAIRKWISDNSALYGLMRALYSAVSQKRYGNLGEDADEHSFEAHAKLPGRIVFDADPRFRTVFLDPDYYMQGMNLEDARIREGKRITEAALRSIQARLRDKGIRLLVVLFPTKETAYAQLMRDQQQKVPDAYFTLVAKEQRLTEELETYLKSLNIEFINLTPALRTCFDKGLRPYPPSDNTHPNATGYEAVAEAVAQVLTRGQP